MKEIIARKYIKALCVDAKQKDLKKYLELLKQLADASRVYKFQEIVESPYVTSEQKIDFILQKILEDTADAQFVNFIKILAEHKRLNIFQELYLELSSYLSSFSKRYPAVLFTNEKYNKATLDEIKEKVGEKLEVSLDLKQQITDKVGIKLVVEDLGVEISFSQEKFIQDLKNHIFKAF